MIRKGANRYKVIRGDGVFVLPPEYQQVEYLQNTQGGDYIDTGFIPTITMKYRIVFEMTEKQTRSFGHLLSTYKTGNRYVVQVRGGSLSDNKNLLCIFRGSSSIVQYDKNINTQIEVIVDNNTYTIDGVIRSFNGQFTETDSSFCLFADKIFNPLNNYALAKVYIVQIWDNNIPVRNLIPCYRKSDSVAGMYDTVNGVFYTNQGTGSFVVGNNVYGGGIFTVPKTV